MTDHPIPITPIPTPTPTNITVNWDVLREKLKDYVDEHPKQFQQVLGYVQSLAPSYVYVLRFFFGVVSSSPCSDISKNYQEIVIRRLQHSDFEFSYFEKMTPIFEVI